MFAGIMGFIYSDLMVPPLVKINAKYYGWKTALYIAGIMYVSIVITAVLLHYGFLAAGMTPESYRQVTDIVAFRIDYTFYLNILALAVVGMMIWLARHGKPPGRDHDARKWTTQDFVTAIFIVLLTGGLLSSVI